MHFLMRLLFRDVAKFIFPPVLPRVYCIKRDVFLQLVGMGFTVTFSEFMARVIFIHSTDVSKHMAALSISADGKPSALRADFAEEKSLRLSVHTREYRSTVERSDYPFFFLFK